jgi:release factor glutamine methyltransferase
VITTRPDDADLRAVGVPSVVGDLVEAIRIHLSDADMVDSADEARDIVAAVMGTNRFWPRLHADEAVSQDVATAALGAADRRASGMPFAYAVGRAAFRHLTLFVNDRVLIPRQETELLIDLVMQRRSSGVCADVGTGSGAIALALAAEGSYDRIVATDVDAAAIAVARMNASGLRSSLRIAPEFRHGDLLAPLFGERFDVIVSNPPYIAFEEASELPESVRNWEPSHALFAASHGLAAIRRIISDAPGILSTGGLLALEVDSRRARQVEDLVKASGCFDGVAVCPDLAGRDRFVLATRST